MSDLIYTPDEYVSVGKPQALHHAYIYYPPSENTVEGKKIWVSKLNLIFTIRRVRINDEGKRVTLDLPMQYGNWELTVGDVNGSNRLLSEPENERRNIHRYLSSKEIAYNSTFAQYSTESQRITWDIFFEQWFQRSRTYTKNKDALNQAILSTDSLRRLPYRKKIEERDRAINERDKLIAKGMREWRRQHGVVNRECVLLSAIDKFKLGELNVTIKVLTEIICS